MAVAGFWAVANGGTVTNTNDSGTGSLRQAIVDAATGDTITFDPTLTGTITLTTGALVIANKNLTIQGPGPSVVTISGNNNSGVFTIMGSGSICSISGLTITGGHPSTASGATFGGGISHPTGYLKVSNCAITANTATAGGGIFNNGTLDLTNCTVSGNQATNTAAAEVEGPNVVVASNGGGVYNDTNGNLGVNSSTISGNTATDLGGGIFNTAAGDALEISEVVRSSTFSGNSAEKGGAIYNSGNLGVGSSTITGNLAALEGGGIFNGSGTAAIIDIRSSIIAGNTAENGPDVAGTFDSGGFNLIGKSEGSTGFGEGITDQTGTIAAPLDPGLDPNGLQDNGGPTRTINLVAGSAAIDKGNSSGGILGLATDQCGRSRVFDFDNIANATG